MKKVISLALAAVICSASMGENDFQVESTLIAMSANGLEMPDLQISPAKAQIGRAHV